MIYARNKWLSNDGIILPNRITFQIAGIEDRKFKKEKFDYWESVYGINMKVIK